VIAGGDGELVAEHRQEFDASLFLKGVVSLHEGVEIRILVGHDWISFHGQELALAYAHKVWPDGLKDKENSRLRRPARARLGTKTGGDSAIEIPLSFTPASTSQEQRTMLLSHSLPANLWIGVTIRRRRSTEQGSTGNETLTGIDSGRGRGGSHRHFVWGH
jgi:hypothetical protein